MKLHLKQRIDFVIGGFGIICLRPVATALGTLFKRDHTPVVNGSVAVIKMLGGGSLVIGMPALLGLRRTYPGERIILVTTGPVKPFADMLAVFDEIVVVNDTSVPKLIVSGVRLVRKLFRTDTTIDFEVYSRLTTVLATILCARNRINFYLESTFWRERVATHLIFFNRYAGSYHFYESAVATVGAQPIDLVACGLHLAQANEFKFYTPSRDGRVTVMGAPNQVCIAPACSDLGKERMLSGTQWERVLPGLIGTAQEVVILGGPADHHVAESLIQHGTRVVPGISWVNACDGRSLRDSLHVLAGCSRLIAIDSSLLHFARLFGVPTVSFWGPTDPMTRLKGDVPNEHAWYHKLPCSPCVHVAETPPCFGQNHCIEAAVRLSLDEEVDSLMESNFPPPFVRLEIR
jgi:ADP-heptose:LPS heptosyltransferase